MLPAAATSPQGRSEERQQYAASVMQRFRRKLLGHESGGEQDERLDGDGSPLSVEAAVDRLIAMATDPRNLARMYEGWMPWV
jgi:phosphatidylinositol kinase/protein kinase (PI-3  family)